MRPSTERTRLAGARRRRQFARRIAGARSTAGRIIRRLAGPRP